MTRAKLPSDQFVSICTGVDGGLLFEHFAATGGNRVSRRAVLALAKVCRDEKRECTAQESADLVEDERVAFFFHILSLLKNRGRAANRQLFFVTLLAQARGLSRAGMEFMQSLGACLAPRTFDLELATFMLSVESKQRSPCQGAVWTLMSHLCVVCSAVQGEVHVVWLDNFSKFYAIAVQGLGGAAAECLWTARGLHRYVGPPVSSAIVPGLRGMPEKLFAAPLGVLFKQKMAAADAVSVGYFRDSVCFKHTVRRIPLKPVVCAAAEPELAAVLRESRDGMRNFFPLGMLPENIGANRGLLLLLKELFGVQPRPGHYSFLCVDCNIFLRILKVGAVCVVWCCSLILMGDVLSVCLRLFQSRPWHW